MVVETDEEINVEGKLLESVDSFCYLGDMISAGGGCETAAITRARTALGKYRDLLPIFALSSKSFALETKGPAYAVLCYMAVTHGLLDGLSLSQTSVK